MFFRIVPDLQMETRLSNGMIKAIADISKALESRGTKLVYVPVPTKGLVHSDQIGTHATRLGFDVRVARALYADTLSKLRSLDVTTIDAVEGLSGVAWPEETFFSSDPRMTNTGLRVLSIAIANEVGGGVTGGSAFSTSIDGELVLESHDRFIRQLSCQATLPEAKTPRYVTSKVSVDYQPREVIVVGSRITNGDERNFAGFLSQALGREVTSAQPAESALSAMAAYLTSDSFAQTAPDVLIWAVPIWENPATNGDQPLRELAAASMGRCANDGLTSSDGKVFDLDWSSLTPEMSLRIEAENAISAATFDFTDSQGTSRIRTVVRPDIELATKRIFLPLTSLGSRDPEQVRISVNNGAQTQVRLTVCSG